MTESTHPLGLALSGGGSRAMAFHCGLLIALDDIGLLKKVNVLSTVSGGSVLGAAWMAHKTDTPNATINDFELKIKKEIISGILIKTYWRLIFNLKYAFSPIKLLQKNLEEKLNLKKEIKELKKYPIIVINTTILNHQQNGPF
jgi:predicted acylesterase/phospholipase RssA